MSDKKNVKKVVLAYSGGLDTSIIIPWLKENYGDPEIVAVSGDVGQGTELDGLEEKAIKTGASKLYVEDSPMRWWTRSIIPSMQMGAKYEDYLLGTAFARPIIAKRLVEIAKEEGGRRHLPRLHRQGQRSGALRAGDQALRPRDEDHRPLAGVGHQGPGRGDRLRRGP